MIAAVVDTNVLASGFTIQGGASDLLLRAWLAGAWDLIVSDHILAELERTFQKRYFLQRLTRSELLTTSHFCEAGQDSSPSPYKFEESLRIPRTTSSSPRP